MGHMDGVLIIDKPAGITSHDVVARVRKILGERRVGHTGTLDPFATGVLVAMIGRATRLAQFLSGSEKEYEAVIRLGYATDTGDVTGARLDQPDRRSTPRLSEAEIETAMASLRGEIEQVPPMYSAKKIAGQKLYDLARRGEKVERQPVRVTISEFETLGQTRGNEEGYGDLKARVVCSAGTYIRTLAEDLGKRLGTGAHLSALRRTRAGQFRIEEALTLDRLAEISESIESKIISADMALSWLPALDLTAEQTRASLNGIDVKIEDSRAWADDQPVRMRSPEGRLIAVGIFNQAEKFLHPAVVIGG